MLKNKALRMGLRMLANTYEISLNINTLHRC
jgi:hypothetical protein